jgi:hypothetical protein
MNHPEDRLSSAFRDLAAEAPRGAPAGLGLTLKNSFRRHHARRRRVRAYTVASLSACVIFSFLFVVTRGPSTSPQAPGDSSTEAINPGPAAPQATDEKMESTPGSNQAGGESADPGRARGPHNTVFVGEHARRNRSSSRTSKDFIPLPSYHPDFPSEGYQIVRVGLQDASLSQLGLPVREDSSGRRVIADLLVDRDGLPMAVRFVGWQRTQ